MTFSKKPSDHFDGYELVAAAGTVTAQSICIPVASITGLTAAEANATTGDIREVMRTTLETFYNYNQSLPEADRSSKMTITELKSDNTNDSNKKFITYTVKFQTELPVESMKMQDE